MRRGSIESESWFNWECTMVHLTAHQINPGALLIEPWLTLKWTLTHFEMNPGALFSKLKKLKKHQCLKTKTKTGKAINLKIYLLVYGQTLIFNLGIPLTEAIKIGRSLRWEGANRVTMDFMVDFRIYIHIPLRKYEAHVHSLLDMGSLGDSPLSYQSNSDDFLFLKPKPSENS